MILVTGATGKLGRLVVESLLRRGVPASEIIAGARNPDKAHPRGSRCEGEKARLQPARPRRSTPRSPESTASSSFPGSSRTASSSIAR